MQTVYTYARLLLGSGFVFWALWLLLRSEAYPLLGIVVGAVGMSVTLFETAFVVARFVRASSEDLK